MISDPVDIWHPGTGARATVSRASYERRSSKLGWELTKAIAELPTDALDGFVAAIDEKEQLRAWLTNHNIPFDGRWGLDRLRAAKAAAE